MVGPRRGWRCWVVPWSHSRHMVRLYCCFKLTVTTRHPLCAGQLNAFGVFQTYYAEHQLADRSASDISWIGSIQLSAIYFCGLLLGPAMDRYGATVYLFLLCVYVCCNISESSEQVLLVSGWLLSTFCLMMLSLSKTYYQIFLSHGLGFGIGLALQ